MVDSVDAIHPIDPHDAVAPPATAARRVELEVRIEPLARELLDGMPAGGEERVRVDVGLLPVFSDERPLQGLAGFIDWRVSGRVSRLVRAGLCSGRDGDALLMPGGRGLPCERMVFVGLGPRDSFDLAAAGAVASRLAATARSLGAREVVLALPASGRDSGRLELLVDTLVRELLRGGGGEGDVDAAGGPADAAPAAIGEPPARWWFVAPPEAVARLRGGSGGPPPGTVVDASSRPR